MSSQKKTPKLAVGQTLYREKPQRGRSWERAQPEVQRVEVATVGSKYFTIAEDASERYVKATLRSEYGHSAYALHLTAQEITDEWERIALQRELRNVFDYQFVPLALVRQVASLLAEQLAEARKPLR